MTKQAKTDKEKAAAKATKEAAVEAEKERYNKLTDAEKAIEKAAKMAARPVVALSLSDVETRVELLNLTTQNRAFARAVVLVANENGIACKATVEVKPRELKFIDHLKHINYIVV